MNSSFSPKSRKLTYNSKGHIIKEETAGLLKLDSGVDLNKTNFDGVIFVSTDAAKKMTERAAGIAFDKWATDFLSHAPPQATVKTLEEEEIVSEETTEMPPSNSKVDISKKKSEQIVPLLKGSKTSVTSDAESRVDPESSPMKKIKAD